MKIQVLFQQQKENILTLTISTTMDLSGFLRSTLCGPGMDFATAFMIFIRSIPLFARASYNTANCTEVQKSQTPSQYVIRFQIVMYTVAKGCSLHRYYIGTQPNSQQNLVVLYFNFFSSFCFLQCWEYEKREWGREENWSD